MHKRVELSLSYRLAGDGDFDSVFDLYMDKISNAFLTYDFMEKKEFRNIFLELLSTNTLFVAELEGEIAASYRLIRKTHRQAGTAYLGGFVVKNSLRGRGVATHVLLHIHKEAKLNRLKRVELTVNVDNAPAIDLYKKFGFVVEGITKMSYRLNSTEEYFDEYLMALIL